MSRRTLVIALFVSLALNLFVLGVVAGVLGSRWTPLRPEGRPGGTPLAAALATLPPERREGFRDAGRRGATPALREARQLRRAAFRTFSEEPFDPEAALALLEQARANEQAGRSEVDRRLVDFAATLTPQERARFGEALANPRPRGHRGGPLAGPSGGHQRGLALPDR